MMPAVPGSAEEITAAWMAAALGGGSPHVIALTRIGVGYGLASEVHRVALRGSGVPQSVVVKLWDTEQAAGTREVSFYRTFGADPGIRVPRCHHAATDSASHRGVLVLEDVANAEQGDCLDAIDPRRAVTLAESMAGLHARWWDHPDLHAHDWLPSDRKRLRDEEWFASRGAEFLRRFPSRLNPRCRALFDAAPRLAARSNEILGGYPETLLHADFHLDNVLFISDGGPPVILDWARVARGPAVLDLGEIVFLMGCVDHADAIISGYLLALRGRGVTSVEETDLRRGLTGFLLRRFIITTYGVAGWKTASSREESILHRGLERIQEAVDAWSTQHPEAFSL